MVIDYLQEAGKLHLLYENTVILYRGNLQSFSCMLEEAGGFGPNEVALVRSILFYFRINASLWNSFLLDVFFGVGLRHDGRELD